MSEELTEAFSAAIDEMVRDLSLEDYLAALIEMRTEINSRMAAVREDMAREGE